MLSILLNEVRGKDEFDVIYALLGLFNDFYLIKMLSAFSIML